MANIIQIQDRLKGVRDEDLVKYVKNPTGDVPSYLALGEIKRRKETRDKYTKEKTATTVADDLTTSSMPSGLRSMAQTQPRPPVQPTAGVGAPPPTPQMNPAMLAQSGVGSLNPGSMRKMADGGIIGFKDRGAVLKPSDYDTDYSYMYNEGLLGGPGKEDVQYPIGTFLGDAASYLNPLSYLDSYDPRFDPVSNEVVSGVGDRFADTKKEIEKRKILKRDFLENKKAEQGIIERQNEIVNDVTVGEERNYAGSRQPAENIPSILNNQKDKIVAADKNEETIIESDVSEVVDGIDETESLEEVIRQNQINQTNNSKNSLPARPDLDVFKDIEDVGVVDFKSLKDMFDKDRTAATTEVLETNKALGLSQDPFKNSLQKIKNMREKTKDNKSEAGNLALIEAGLLIAQNGNIGDAAQAVQNYGKALKDLRGEDREIAKLDIQLEAADIAFKTGQAREVGLLLQSYQKGMKDISVAELNAKQNTAIANSNNKYKGLVANVSAQTNMYGAELGFEGTKNRSRTATQSLVDIAQNDPAYLKKGSKGNVVFDAEKFIRDTNRGSSYGGADLTYRLINAYNDRMKQLENSLDSDALNAFKEQYPNEQAYVNAFLGMNSGLGSTGTQGSGYGFGFGQPTIVKE